MLVEVKIMPRKGVLDPQGKAISGALEHMGYEGVVDVRQGKLITLELKDGTSEDIVRDMCDRLLANPVTEDYEVTIPSIVNC